MMARRRSAPDGFSQAVYIPEDVQEAADGAMRDHAPRTIHWAIHLPPPAFMNIRQSVSRPGPLTPPRRPGALVTSRQDLLITVRTVITTVRLQPGPTSGAAMHARLSRWYFAFCKYLVTCDVRAWQLISKVSAAFGH